jgi:hypothetical protein
MKQVTMYEAKDGTIFTSKGACMEHEAANAARDTFVEWYDSHGLWGDAPYGMVSAAKLIEWLYTNQAEVSDLLGIRLGLA